MKLQAGKNKLLCQFDQVKKSLEKNPNQTGYMYAVKQQQTSLKVISSLRKPSFTHPSECVHASTIHKQ